MKAHRKHAQAPHENSTDDPIWRRAQQALYPLPAGGTDSARSAALLASVARETTTRGARFPEWALDQADEACRKVFVLAKEHPATVPLFVQTAHSWLCRKANDDAHEYKFLAAILEDAAKVSPAWQPHLLAASVHYFHGKQTPDNSVIQHVQEALLHKR